MNPASTFSNDQHQLWQHLSSRLLAGEPIQYITRRAWFCGLELEVGPGVLIPRPETEELVAWLLEMASPNLGHQVLDIGTGSGCIALALANALPVAEVTGIDFSETAIETAGANAKKLGLHCDFRVMDIDTATAKDFYQLDFVISNPPYIPIGEKKTMDPLVTEHEPGGALFVPDDDPLLYYNKVCDLSMHWLKRGGWLFFETHEDFAEKVAMLMRESGYFEVSLRHDLSGRERMVRGKTALSSL